MLSFIMIPMKRKNWLLWFKLWDLLVSSWQHPTMSISCSGVLKKGAPAGKCVAVLHFCCAREIAERTDTSATWWRSDRPPNSADVQRSLLGSQIIKPWKMHAWCSATLGIYMQKCQQTPFLSSSCQDGITGSAINQANEVLRAIWPCCPHDMICGILLPLSPLRLSERPFGRVSGEWVKPRWCWRGAQTGQGDFKTTNVLEVLLWPTQH